MANARVHAGQDKLHQIVGMCVPGQSECEGEREGGRKAKAHAKTRTHYPFAPNTRNNCNAAHNYTRCALIRHYADKRNKNARHLLACEWRGRAGSVAPNPARPFVRSAFALQPYLRGIL